MLLVQVVALIVWQQGVHFLLSNQHMLMGWYPCRVVYRADSDIGLLQPSVAGGSASNVFHLLNNFSLASSIFVKFSTRYNLQTNSSASWTLDVLRSPSPRCWSSLCTWRTCLMPFSWCGQKSRRWCHNRFREWKFLSDSMYCTSAAWTCKGGFEPRVSRLWVCHSTTELTCSTHWVSPGYWVSPAVWNPPPQELQ